MSFVEMNQKWIKLKWMNIVAALRLFYSYVRYALLILQEKQLKTSDSVRSEMPTLSAKLLQELSDLDETIFMGMNKNASLREAEIIFSSTACLNASFPMTG